MPVQRAILLVALMLAVPTTAYIAGLASSAAVQEALDEIYFDNVTDLVWAVSQTGSNVYVFNSTLALLSTIQRNPPRTALGTFQAVGRQLLVCDLCQSGSYNMCDLYDLDNFSQPPVSSLNCLNSHSYFFIRLLTNAAPIFAASITSDLSNNTYLNYHTFSTSAGLGLPEPVANDNNADKTSPAYICSTSISVQKEKVSATEISTSSTYTFVYYADFIETNLRLWCQTIDDGSGDVGFAWWSLFTYTNGSLGTIQGYFFPHSNTYSNVITSDQNPQILTTQPLVGSDGQIYWLAQAPTAFPQETTLLISMNQYTYFNWSQLSPATTYAVPDRSVATLPNQNFIYYPTNWPSSITAYEAFSLAQTIDDITFASTPSEIAMLFIGDLSSTVNKFTFSRSASQFNLAQIDTTLDNTLPGVPTSFVAVASKQVVYGAVSTTLISFPFSACNASTCNACVALNDLYCGWCTLQNACTSQSQCLSYSISNSWLNYMGATACPAVTSLSPLQYPINKQTTVTWSTNLPDISTLKPSSYTCVFTQQNGAVITSTATGSSGSYQCTAGPFSSPLVGGLNETILASLAYNSSSIGLSILFSANPTIYDCSQGGSTCQQCAAITAFPCGYCTRLADCTLSQDCPLAPWTSSPASACPLVSSYSPKIFPVGVETTQISIYVNNFGLLGSDIALLRFMQPNGTTLAEALTITNPFQAFAPYFGYGSLPNGVESLVAQFVLNNVPILSYNFSFVAFDCNALGPNCLACVAASAYGCTWNIQNWECVPGNLTGATYYRTASQCPYLTGIDGAIDNTYYISSTTTSTETLKITSNVLLAATSATYSCSFVNTTLGLIYNVQASFTAGSTQLTCGVPAVNVTSPDGYLDYTMSVFVYAFVANNSPGASYQLFPTTTPLIVRYFNCTAFSSCRSCNSQAISTRSTPISNINNLCGWCSPNGCLPSSSYSSCSNSFINNITLCPLPVITSFTPTSAFPNGGEVIQILGVDFGLSQSDLSLLTVGQASCDPPSGTFVSFDLIECVLQPLDLQFVTVGEASGAIDLLTSFSDVTVVSSQTFSFLSLPSLTSFTPTQGVIAGGTVITITGSNLLEANVAYSVSISSAPCVILPAQRTSSTIVCTLSTTNISLTAGTEAVLQLHADSYSTNATSLFTWRGNPVITSFTPNEAIISGGFVITLTGMNLDAGQAVISLAGQACAVQTVSSTVLTCKLMANKPTITTGFFGPVVLSIDLASTTANTPFSFCPNPTLQSFSPTTGSPSGGFDVFIQGTNLRCGELPVITVAGVPCTIDDTPETATNQNYISCNVASSRKRTSDGTSGPISLVWTDFTLTSATQFTFTNAGGTVGPSSQASIWIIPVVIILVILLILFAIFVIYAYRRRIIKNFDESDRMLLEISGTDQFAYVASEPKDSYVDFSKGSSGGLNPLFLGDPTFLDYDIFISEILFSKSDGLTPPQTIAFATRQHDLTLAQNFRKLLLNKEFTLTFIEILEQQASFNTSDRKYFAALLLIAVKDDFAYFTDLLFTLLSKHIATMIAVNQQKTLMRDSDPVVENMLTAWLTFALEPYLKDRIAKPLFALFGILKAQIEQGAVDALTGSSQYTINAAGILRQKVPYERLKLKAEMPGKDPIEVDVNSCDSAGQLKYRLLDAFNIDFRRFRDFGIVTTSNYRVQDTDASTIKEDSTWAKINTVQFYKLRNLTEFRLVSQSSSTIEQKAPAGMRLYHLEKQIDATAQHVTPTETFFTRMMTVKEVIKVQVDSLMHALFPGRQDNVPVPPFIKQLFDFLDAKAKELKVTDTDVIHTWKSNSLATRLWVSVINNPDQIFDVNKTIPIQNCLSTISQVVVDSSSTSDIKLGPGAPASKLLYRSEVGVFKKVVKQYYAVVASAPASGTVSQPSFTTAFDSDTASFELVSFARKYNKEVYTAIMADPTKAEQFKDVAGSDRSSAIF